MSLLFTGQVPIPDIKGALDKTSAILQNHGALELKKRAAQAKSIKDLQKNRADIAAMQGGLHEVLHPFINQSIDEPKSWLSQMANQYLGDPNGSALISPIVDNWKKSAKKYETSEKLTAADHLLGAQVDPTKQPAIDLNASLGSLYTSDVTAESWLEAQQHQYKGLASEVEFVGNPDGSWSFIGFELDRNGDRISGEKKDISEMSAFNNPHAFDPQTRFATGFSQQDHGSEIKAVEKGQSGRSYNAVDVTARYKKYWETPLNVSDMKEGNKPFEYRRTAFVEGEDYLRSILTTSGKYSQEELFSFFSLDPAMREGDSTTFDAVETYMKNYWQETLPFIEYPDDDDDVADQQSLFSGAVAAGWTETELPTNITTSADGKVKAGDIIEGLVRPDFGQDPNARLRTVSYPVVNMPSNNMENVKIPAYNEDYYNKMDLFAGLGLVKYNPITREPYPVEGKLGKNPATAQAVVNLFATQSPVKSESIQDIIMYEGNPGIFSVKTANGDVVSVDINNLNAYTQSIYSAVKTGLRKSKMDISDLYTHSNEIDWSEGVTPAGPANPVKFN